MPNEQAFNRTELTPAGDGRLRRVEYDVTSESGARRALADVASRGTRTEKTAVRAAVAKHFPDLSKVRSPRDLFPNSNMKD